MWTRAAALTGLSALAVLINLNAPTIFFDVQLMFGTAVAVLALLLFGWSGLVVGAPALMVTVWRWGHPFELLIGMGQLVWLAWVLARCRRTGPLLAEGRIVLAALAYWLVVGIPAEVVVFTRFLGIDRTLAFTLGLKEALVAVLSTAMGLGVCVLWRLLRGQGRPALVSVRSLVVAAVVLAVSLPWLVGLITLSADLKITLLKRERQDLGRLAALVTAALEEDEQVWAGGLPDGLAARWRKPDGGAESSDPALFERLDRDFTPDSPDRIRLRGLDLLVPTQVSARLPTIRQAFWRLQAGALEVVRPAWPLINTLDVELMLPRLRWLGVTVLLAVAMAELLVLVLENQLAGMVRPLQRQPEAGHSSDLADSSIVELQQVVELVNERGRRARQLSTSLRQARDELAHTALSITEAIPVGTYTTVMAPGEEEARFSFVSDRFLEICGLERAALEGVKVSQAFHALHPDDGAEFLRLEREAIRHRRPFRGQGRVLVNGTTRWLRAESVPRSLPDGSTIWEGVLTDVTEEEDARERLAAQELQLRRILDFLPVPIGINRLEPPQEILFLNRAFLDTFGYAPEELPDTEAWAALAYDDPAYRETLLTTWIEGVDALASGGTLPPLDVRLLCRDRSRREVILRATRLDELMLCTFEDVTERKQAAAAQERALRRETELKERQRRELEAKLRTSLTAAAVAHEINQPLSAILMNTQLLQGQLDKLPEGDPQRLLRPLLEIQLRETERIVETIERMRMLLRNVRTDAERIDLSEVVASAHLYLAGLISATGVTLEVRGVDQPSPLMGDAAQLQIAVANLIRNAVEALDEAAVLQPRVRLQVEHGHEPDGGHWLELRIADNGPGFADHDLDHLLLASTKAGGSGIGLFVAATRSEERV